MYVIKRFEDIEIRQIARDIAQKAYPPTLQKPNCKEYRLAGQMKGSCGSAMDKIAEGFDLGNRIEFINSHGIAGDHFISQHFLTNFIRSSTSYYEKFHL